MNEDNLFFGAYVGHALSTNDIFIFEQDTLSLLLSPVSSPRDIIHEPYMASGLIEPIRNTLAIVLVKWRDIFYSRAHG